jgi:hypothetical protein
MPLKQIKLTSILGKTCQMSGRFYYNKITLSLDRRIGKANLALTENKCGLDLFR